MILELETYEVLDDRFYGVRGDATLTTHYSGCRWAEGPAYFPAHRTVVWSDIPNDRLLRFDEVSETVSVFRSPAGHPNGNTTDAQGRLITCEHSNRRVTRTEHDGSITVLADRNRAGRRFNSPNDVAVAADGALWFTDASYGIDSDYEGRRAPQRARRLLPLPGRPGHRRGPCHGGRFPTTDGHQLLPRRHPAVRRRQPRQHDPQLPRRPRPVARRR